MNLYVVVLLRASKHSREMPRPTAVESEVLVGCGTCGCRQNHTGVGHRGPWVLSSQSYSPEPISGMTLEHGERNGGPSFICALGDDGEMVLAGGL